MHLDKWKEIKEKILGSFEILEDREEKNEERKEILEIIEFNGPLGKMRIEWVTRPKVLEKKTQYSRRIGSGVGVDYIYSDDEVTHTFKVYKWDSVRDDWQEIKGDSIF